MLEESLFNQIIETVGMGFVVLDRQLTVQSWNRWMTLNSRIHGSQILGQPLFQFYPELDSPMFRRTCGTVFSFGHPMFLSQKLHKHLFAMEVPGNRGSRFERMQQSCSVIPLRDPDGTINHLCITVNDVTEIADYEQKLMELSTRDGLTGVFNRRHFEGRLKMEFERHRRYQRPLSVVMMYIDHFKSINDTHGHPGGDAVLKSVAALAQSRLRDVDLMARYGGEEFCCLLPETSFQDAMRVAERIRAAIASGVHRYLQEKVSVTISLGVSHLSEACKDPFALVKEADSALYLAKHSGRNRVVGAEPGMAGPDPDPEGLPG